MARTFLDLGRYPTDIKEAFKFVMKAADLKDKYRGFDKAVYIPEDKVLVATNGHHMHVCTFTEDGWNPFSALEITEPVSVTVEKSMYFYHAGVDNASWAQHYKKVLPDLSEVHATRYTKDAPFSLLGKLGKKLPTDMEAIEITKLILLLKAPLQATYLKDLVGHHWEVQKVNTDNGAFLQKPVRFDAEDSGIINLTALIMPFMLKEDE